jgi:hypothetical protein
MSPSGHPPCIEALSAGAQIGGMSNAPRLVVTVVLLAAADLGVARAAVLDIPPTPLLLRIYGTAVLPSDTSEVAQREATAILEAAGFAPEWVACGVAPAPGDRCSSPLAPMELAVRVVSLAEPPRPDIGPSRYLPLGYSLIEPGTKTGSLATIYLNRVAWLAADWEVATAVMLGRAVAHELGHLLLGTSGHTATGVMRAVWSREAMRTGRANDWRFTAADARSMRAGVLTRSRPRRERADARARIRPDCAAACS